MWEIYYKLTIKIPERRHGRISFLIKMHTEAYNFIKKETLAWRLAGVFIVNFGHISHSF